MNLTVRILLAMVAGGVIGALLQAAGVGPGSFIDSWFTHGIIEVGGAIFVNSLKLMVVPLVFVSLVCGASSLSGGNLGRLGGKTLALYLFTTGVAITLALTLALVIAPGEGTGVSNDATSFVPKESQSVKETIIDVFPTNPVAAMANGKMLQVIVFALLFGVAITHAGEAGGRVRQFFEDLNEVIMALVTMLIKLVHISVVMPALLVLLARVNPLQFFKKMREPMLLAFSTSSSAATLPVTMRTVTERVGVDDEVASFVLPMGVTINMDGTAIMQGVATVFIAQFYAIDLTTTDYLLVIVTATLASIGAAGVPGVGLITLALVLEQVGLPVEGIALIIGVDRLLDMMRTVVNISGDGTVATVVARSEGRFDDEVFADVNAGLVFEEARR